jgi:hypothetical protein
MLLPYPEPQLKTVTISPNIVPVTAMMFQDAETEHFFVVANI